MQVCIGWSGVVAGMAFTLVLSHAHEAELVMLEDLEESQLRAHIMGYIHEVASKADVQEVGLDFSIASMADDVMDNDAADGKIATRELREGTSTNSTNSTKPEPTPAPTPQPEPTLAPTPQPEPTPAPTPEPTPAPTPQPEPTPAPTPQPEPTPSPTPQPELTPAPTPEVVEPTKVRVSLIIGGIDYNKLWANPDQEKKFKEACAWAQASRLGIDVSLISILLIPGSVTVVATITPPVGVELDQLQKQVNAAQTDLEKDVVATIQEAADNGNLGDAVTGTIEVIAFTSSLEVVSCTCRSGSPAEGRECPADGAEVCQSCDERFVLNVGKVCEAEEEEEEVPSAAPPKLRPLLLAAAAAARLPWARP